MPQFLAEISVLYSEPNVQKRCIVFILKWCFIAMLGGCRRIILAIAGLILIGASNPSQDSPRNPATAQTNQEATQHEKVAAGVNRMSDPNEKERNEREILVLRAQENSAYWAAAMFWATTAALVLSAVGIGLVYNTFSETKKANNIAKESAFKQLRAYVTVEKATTSSVNFPDENEGFQGVRIILHNSGATPAVGVSVTFKKSVVLGESSIQTDETISVADIGGQARQEIDLPWYKWEDFVHSFTNGKIEAPTKIIGIVQYQTAIPDDTGETISYTSEFNLEPADGYRREAISVEIIRMPNKHSF